MLEPALGNPRRVDRDPGARLYWIDEQRLDVHGASLGV
jgi:hypothetical protein